MRSAQHSHSLMATPCSPLTLHTIDLVQALMKRNSVYLVFIFGGAILGERVGCCLQHVADATACDAAFGHHRQCLCACLESTMYEPFINNTVGGQRRLQQHVGVEQQGGACLPHLVRSELKLSELPASCGRNLAGRPLCALRVCRFAPAAGLAVRRLSVQSSNARRSCSRT